MKTTKIDPTAEKNSRLRSSARWMRRHPRTVSGTIAVSTAVTLVGWQTLVAVLGITTLCGISWRWLDQPTFDRIAGQWMRAWYQRWLRYQRKWPKAAQRCGLVVQELDGSSITPKIVKVRSSLCWDTVQIRLEEGQDVQQYQDAAEKLRHVHHVERVAVREVHPGKVALDYQRIEPFDRMHVKAAALPKRAEDVDLRKLPVGLTEYGTPWTISVLDSHTANAGETGAGKGSLPWNVMRAMAPLIASGTVNAHGLDPKGMELAAGKSLFTSYARDDKECVELLEHLVEQMNQRKKLLGDEGIRKFTPSRETPLEWINIDELAPLLSYASRSDRGKMSEALGMLLTQGRSVGYSLFGSIQEPTKDVFTVRDLFPRRVAMRLPSASYVDATLGDDAVEVDGALSHKIPERLPGVAYVKQEGKRGVTRVRAGWVDDQDLRDLCDYIERARTVVNLDEHRQQRHVGTEDQADAA